MGGESIPPGRGSRSQEAGPLLAAAAAAFDGEELALLHVEAATGASLHRDPRLGPIGEAAIREHLPLMETGAAQGFVVGVGAAGGGQFNGEHECWNVRPDTDTHLLFSIE